VSAGCTSVVPQASKIGEGLDAATGEYVDMIKIGIIADKPDKAPAGGGMGDRDF